MTSNILNSSIAQVAQLLSRGAVTAQQLTDLCLKRIARTEKLNAFVTVTHDLASEKAAEADKRLADKNRLSLLDGIPIAVKDNFCTHRVRTTCASRMLAEYRPPFDATVVEKLVEGSGAVPLGKTNLDEFAMGSGCFDSIFGPTVNPWKSGLLFDNSSSRQSAEGSPEDRTQKMLPSKDPIDANEWYVSGGSSGGSAVAVAVGACFAAIGSDTGGSTRNPAARVGVVGFKPTYGTVSRFGLIPLTHSMDVPGILARSVRDAALVFERIRGHDPKDSTSVPFHGNIAFDSDLGWDKISVGVPEEYVCPGMSSEVIDLWRSTCDLLSNLGADVNHVSLPHTKYSISCYSVLNACEVASNFSCYDGIEYGHRAENSETSTEELYEKSRHEGFSQVVRGRILAGNYFLLRENYEEYLEQALKVRRLIAEEMQTVFKNGVHLLLTPVTLTEALSYSQWISKDNREQASREDYCTQPANMAGVPALSVPCKLSERGLPLSLQLIGPRFSDYFLFSAGQKLENIMQFPSLVCRE